MPVPKFILIDLSLPAHPRCRGEFPSRREAHRAALHLNLRGYQVRPV